MELQESNMELDQFRIKIDETDRQLVRLLEERFDTAARIGEYKKAHGLAVRDEKREQQKLESIAAICREELRPYFMELYPLIFELTRAYEGEMQSKEMNSKEMNSKEMNSKEIQYNDMKDDAQGE